MAQVFGWWTQTGPGPAAESFGTPKPRGLKIAQSIQPGLDESADRVEVGEVRILREIGDGGGRIDEARRRIRTDGVRCLDHG